MNLLEVSVQADGEAAEAISELFNRLGRGGAVIEESPLPEPRNIVVRTYLLCDDEIDANRRAIEEGLWHLGQLYPIPPAEFRDLKDDDWANAWKSFHPVQHVGPRIVLKPTWREYAPQPHELMIELDPGMAFGTGQHPSTRFCLLAVERLMQPGWRVLDVGTGSGILAILAAKLGAGEVVACDVDPVAVRVSRENVALNGLSDRVSLLIGSVDTRDFGSGVWDLILMNILAPVIVELLPFARPLLRPGGRIVLSGLIATQTDEVRAKMAEVGLAVVEQAQDGDWLMLIGQ
jgi:ribosomal protein L11 methyltransferase